MTTETPKPMQGSWTLTAPDGRTWQADSPMKVIMLEQRERVPPEVALQRITDAVDESDLAERHVQLGKDYGASNTDDLIDKLSEHVRCLERRCS